MVTNGVTYYIVIIIVRSRSIFVAFVKKSYQRMFFPANLFKHLFIIYKTYPDHTVNKITTEKNTIENNFTIPVLR